MADNSVNESVNDVVEPANVFSFGPDDYTQPESSVDGSEEVLDSVEDNEQNPDEEMVENDGGYDRFDGMSQKDIGKAFAAERRRTAQKTRSEIENSDSYKLGQLMIEDIMQTKGVSRSEAYKMANDNFYRAVANRENISPNIAKRIYGEQSFEPSETAEESAERFTDELTSMKLPAGFDLEAASQDPEFAELLLDVGAKSAVRVYAAENSARNAKRDIAEKIQSRNYVPQMTRASQSVSPRTDWTNVSREDFLAEKARRQKYL